MKRKDKSFIILIVLLIISGAISWNFSLKKYLAKDTVDISHFPQKIAAWSSEDLPISAEDYDILETKNVFVRRYTNPQKEKMYLFIVYSQNNRKVSHPPEVCYTGSGISILKHTQNSIAVPTEHRMLEVNELLLAKGKTKQLAFYWFKVGDSFTSSYWKQQILIAVKTLLGQPASSALIRVSKDVENNDVLTTTHQLKEFVALAIPAVHQYLP